MGEAILLQLQFDRAHVIQLFCYSSLATKNFELKIGVRQNGDGVPSIQDRAILDQYLLNATTFDRIQIDSAAGYESTT